MNILTLGESSHKYSNTVNLSHKHKIINNIPIITRRTDENTKNLQKVIFKYHVIHSSFVSCVPLTGADPERVRGVEISVESHLDPKFYLTLNFFINSDTFWMLCLPWYSHPLLFTFIQTDLNSSNTDGSFTMANSNSFFFFFLNPY